MVASWVEKEASSGWGKDCYYSMDENDNESKVVHDGKSVDQFSVYVGNLEPLVSKKELLQCFGVLGEILRVTFIRSSKKDTKTGSGHGYDFRFYMFQNNDGLRSLCL